MAIIREGLSRSPVPVSASRPGWRPRDPQAVGRREALPLPVLLLSSQQLPHRLTIPILSCPVSLSLFPSFSPSPPPSVALSLALLRLSFIRFILPIPPPVVPSDSGSFPVPSFSTVRGFRSGGDCYAIAIVLALRRQLRRGSFLPALLPPSVTPAPI